MYIQVDEVTYLAGFDIKDCPIVWDKYILYRDK